MQKPTTLPPTLAHAFCFIAIAVWSMIELCTKFLGPEASPYAVTAWRFLIGGLVILPFALRGRGKTNPLPGAGELAKLVLLGALNVCVSMLFLQLSVYFGKASVSAVLVSTNPLFVSLFALLLIRERLSLPQIIGLAIASGGIALLILGETELRGARYLNLPLSIAFGLGAALTFGLYTVLTKNMIRKHGNTLTNSVSFLGGAALLFAFSAISGKPVLIPLTFQNAAIMLYLGIIVSGIAYLLFFEGVKKLGAGPSSLYFFLKPALASLLAVLILRESLAGLQILAIGVIVSGLALSRLLKHA